MGTLRAGKQGHDGACEREAPVCRPSTSPGGAVSDEGTCQEADVPGEEDLHRHSGLGAGPGDPSLPTADPGLPAMPLGSPRSMLALLM